MLRTRLQVGSVLILLVVGMLLFDQWLEPYCPFLLLTVVMGGIVCTYEFLQLLPADRRPMPVLAYGAVLLMLILQFLSGTFAGKPIASEHNLVFAFGAFTTILILAFLAEIAQFRESNNSVMRIALTCLIAAYLGMLPAFLVQLRWLTSAVPTKVSYGTLALAAAVFIPKMCDIGAYFTGKLMGRHKMSPTLSPKKTWEGAAGGLVLAAITGLLLQFLGPLVSGGMIGAAIFGVAVGVAGMFGDLAESLIKRDCQQKDASQIVPGFGGVLDILDSILFAAPVVFVWLTLVEELIRKFR